MTGKMVAARLGISEVTLSSWDLVAKMRQERRLGGDAAFGDENASSRILEEGDEPEKGRDR